MTRTSRLFAAVILTMSAYAASEPAAPGQRLSPAEIGAIPHTGASTGTSGVSGIETRVLHGDPTRTGFYSIQLRVPANTRIEAHDHPDDRVGTVVEGTWYFGYGGRFDEKEVKPLPPGSFYTEPPNVPHFARTGSSPVTLHISGFGPSGTRYVGGTDAARTGMPEKPKPMQTTPPVDAAPKRPPEIR
jgi:quercetin dioxygenase-like cupin family protein